MTTQLIKYDYSPYIIAANLVQSKMVGVEQIEIQPAESYRVDHDRAIAGVELLPDNDKIIIRTKSRDNRQTKKTIPQDHKEIVQAIMAFSATQFHRLNIHLELDKRAFGCSGNLMDAFPAGLPHWVNDEQRKKLFYYLPFVEQTAGDLKLLQRVFNQLMNAEILIEEITPKILRIEEEETFTLDSSRLDMPDVLGGAYCSGKKHLKISVKPHQEPRYSDYLPNGIQFKFMDKIICPVFLKERFDWQIEILPNTQIVNWVLEEGNNPAYLGINTLLMD
ncbi:MAG: type VI secretion system baseplate subunit TssG [Bacteroidota bacterium]